MFFMELHHRLNIFTSLSVFILKTPHSGSLLYMSSGKVQGLWLPLLQGPFRWCPCLSEDKMNHFQKSRKQRTDTGKYSFVNRSKVKWSRYRPGVAQRVGRGIAVLFHDHSSRRGWVVSSMLQPHFTPWKDPVPIVQEAGWAPGPVWTGGKSRSHRDLIPDRPDHSHSLYRLSYRAHE